MNHSTVISEINSSIREAIQCFQRTQSPDGGWGPFEGDSSDGWTTAEGLICLHRSQRGTQSQIDLALDWLLKNQLPDGRWGSNIYGNVGDSPSTAYGLIAVAGLGRVECHAAIARAADALVSLQLPSGGWPSVPNAEDEARKGHVGYTAFPLMALARAPKNARRADAIQNGVLYLTSCQNPDGGWGFGPTQLSDPCLTAYVVCAFHDLSKFWHSSVPDGLLELAATFLLRQQNSDGSWRDWQGVSNSPEATSYILEALVRMPNNRPSPRIRQAVSWLISQQRPDGSWPFDPKDPSLACIWGTHNALVALLAVIDSEVLTTHISLNSRGYKTLVEGFRHSPQNFALFLGAGAAMPVLPSGFELARRLASKYLLVRDLNGGGELALEVVRDRFEAEFKTPFRLESVMVFMQDHYAKGESLNEFLRQELESNIEAPPAYTQLSEMLYRGAIPRLLLTTNFDEKLEQTLRRHYSAAAVSRMTVVTEEQWSRCDLREVEHHPILLKIHGSLSQPMSLIASLQEMSHVPDFKKNVLLDCLANYNLLFVGYSFQDPDVSELLSMGIAKGRTQRTRAWCIDPKPTQRASYTLELLRSPSDHQIESTFGEFLEALNQS